MKEIAEGILRKMKSRLEQPVSYKIPLGDNEVPLNPLIAKKIKLEYSGNIFCVNCGRKSNKSFNQGYCYPCFQKLAQCDSCIIHPEKCHFDQGTCREPVWGEKYCMQDHIVYLANSSGLKIGITRATQIPTRWIDQGATQALAIIRVRTRLQSGRVIPLGNRCNLITLSPSTTVCPALFPPWNLATHETSPARRSTNLPLPSSPHWAPNTTCLLYTSDAADE